MNRSQQVACAALIAVVVLAAGTVLAPRLSGPVAPRAFSSFRAAESRDWGGGRLSLANGPADRVIDSVGRTSVTTTARAYAGPEGGVVLQQQPGADCAITLAWPAPGQPGRCAVFKLPSTGRFRKELLPGPGDAVQPAPDIPLYPQSICRTQVGGGTACFVGFYLTSDSVEAVRAFYVRALGQLGWQRVTAGRTGLLESFARRNPDRMVVVQLKQQGPATTRIGMVAMASRSPGSRERN